MREFKFRAITFHGQFEYSSDLYFFEENMIHENDEDTPVMQYTGIKDCNGNEIYEGDFLKYDNPEYKGHDNPYLIRWNEEEAGFECVGNHNFMMADVWGEMEIVGNCIENPELLKEIEELKNMP